jgi:uncharacterized protein
MDYKVSVLGFVVGLLVGLTGMGGGAVMTPALILLGWARPVIAVGTDLVWGTLTKAAGSFVHWRQKTVELKIVLRLACGSVPGALLGLALLVRLHHENSEAMDKFVVRMLGVALMVVALSLFVRTLRKRQIRVVSETEDVKHANWLTPLLGFVIGFLVSLTSVGSGSLIIACLVLLYPHTPLRRIVGSDIVHALILLGVSALGHLGIGSIDKGLLGSLLIGSIPGVWLGSKMTAAVPEKVLQPILATTLFFLGYKLL